MKCSLCLSLTPRAGCLRCEERQPTLFSLPPPDISGADTMTLEELAEEQLRARAAREARLQFYRTLQRPIKIALVSCGKAKLDREAPARELYVGPLFRAALAHAEATSTRSYIISAHHGLLGLERRISPYDRTLSDLSKKERLAWGERIVESLLSLTGGLTLHLFIYAGLDYARPIQAAGRRHAWEIEVPLAKLSIGARLQWFAARKPKPAPAPKATRRKKRGAA